jgi:hypothetical protein
MKSVTWKISWRDIALCYFEVKLLKYKSDVSSSMWTLIALKDTPFQCQIRATEPVNGQFFEVARKDHTEASSL